MKTANVLENLDVATDETFADPATYQKSHGEVEAAIYSRWQQRNRDDLRFEQDFVAREALARCKAIQAAGGKADYDAEHATVCGMIGVSPQTAPAKYSKRAGRALLPGQTNEERKARGAVAECLERQARGEKFDSMEVFRAHGL